MQEAEQEVVLPESRSTFFINAVPGLERAALSTAIALDMDPARLRLAHRRDAGAAALG